MLRAATVLLAALFLGGCAGSYWHLAEEKGEPLRRVDVIDAGASACGCTDPGTWACATRNPLTGVCTVCIPSYIPSYTCVLYHELIHCLGYHHPNFNYGFIVCPE
jgi:hypothetical protein